jgi:SAM-dependent methyltransferase
MERDFFEAAYQKQAPWDIGRPQPEILRLHEAGEVVGSVLDVGCGTGENALYFASHGHEVWGVDFVPEAVKRAVAKSTERGLKVDFQVADALALATLGRKFDTVVDCGLFHVFDDAQRVRFVSGLKEVVREGGRYLLLCFSDEEPPGVGPRRVSRDEIRQSFREGWQVKEISPFRFEVADVPEKQQFSEGGPKAWSAIIIRTITRL